MIKFRPAFASVLALVTFTASSGFAHAAQAISIDCHAMRLPSQQEVGNALGIHNFSEAYAARTRLMQQVRRQCARGATIVRFVPDLAQPPQRELSLEAE